MEIAVTFKGIFYGPTAAIVSLWQFLVLTARKMLYRSVARIASENRFAAGS